MRESPLLGVLIGDGAEYDAWAREIASGEWFGKSVFYQAPLYPYFLAVHYSVFGHNSMIVRVHQAIIGALGCALVAVVGARMLDRRVGLVAGLLLAVYPPAVFFDGAIDKTCLSMFLTVLWVVVMERGARHPRHITFVCAGIVLALLCLLRENALLLLPLALLWPAYGVQGRSWLHSWSGAAMVAVGVALVLLPVGLRNRALGGAMQVTTSQFGPNFYIGNHRGATGYYQPLVPGRGSPAVERKDAFALAEAALGRPLSPAEVSRYWFGKSVEFIRSEPTRWIGLMARKWYLLWNAAEFDDTESIEAHQAESLAIRLPSPLLHFGTLVPLCVIGLLATLGQWRRLWPLWTALLLLGGGVVLFFVFARYRAPMIPLVALFASAGAVAVVDAARRRQGSQLAVFAVFAAASAWFVNRPDHLRTDGVVLNYLNVAIRLMESGQVDAAERCFHKALERRPELPEAHLWLGKIESGRGHQDIAMRHLQRATASSATAVEARTELAGILRSMGRAEEADRQLQEAARQSPQNPAGHYNLGSSYLQSGDWSRAIEALSAAVRINPLYGEAWINLGIALDRKGDRAAAKDAFRKATTIAGSEAEGYFSLGVALRKDGQPADAAEAQERALAIKPAHLNATLELSAYYLRVKRLRDALRVLSLGARHFPDEPRIILALAQLRSSANDDALRDGAEAIRLAQHACAITKHANPTALGTLAAAHAESGEFARAIELARQAITLAQAQQDAATVSAIKEQLDGYEQGRPFRAPWL